MPTNKFNIIEIVNRRYIHPRNIINAVTQRITQFGEDFLEGNDESAFDPTGSDDGDRAVPPEPINVTPTEDSDWTLDNVEQGTTVEQVLSGSDGVYFTSLPFSFFRGVWFDGLEANYLEHWTLSGTALIPNITLLDDTEVIGRYVVGTE